MGPCASEGGPDAAPAPSPLGASAPSPLSASAPSPLATSAPSPLATSAPSPLVEDSHHSLAHARLVASVPPAMKARKPCKLRLRSMTPPQSASIPPLTISCSSFCATRRTCSHWALGRANCISRHLPPMIVHEPYVHQGKGLTVPFRWGGQLIT